MNDRGSRRFTHGIQRLELKIIRYKTETPDMPAVLRRCIGAGGEAPVALLGDSAILEGRLIGFFCSVRCPGDVILKTFDLARSLRDADVTVVGGFQSRMEREFLSLLLRGSARLVVCPARGLGRMRIPRDWKEPIGDGRLVILSFVDDRIRRPTAATAAERNGPCGRARGRHPDRPRGNRGEDRRRSARRRLQTDSRCSHWLR